MHNKMFLMDEIRAGGSLSHASNYRPVIEADMNFGRLTAIRSVGPDPKGHGDLWEFRCSCDGRIVTFSAATVLRKKAPRASCGCLTRENAVRQGKAKHVPLHVAFLRHIDLENRPVPKMCEGFGRCLLWTGSGDFNGRAQMGNKGETMRASHVVWNLYYGRWPKHGACLCHVCNDPACVNPLHLIEADQNFNMYDRAAKNQGGILQACSPHDESSDERNDTEVEHFLRFLGSMADEWQKSKADGAANACGEVCNGEEGTVYREDIGVAIPVSGSAISIPALSTGDGLAI